MSWPTIPTTARRCPLFIASVGQPQAGTAVTNAGQVVYTPNSNFLGDDSFTYTISDGQSTSTATVRVDVIFLRRQLLVSLQPDFRPDNRGSRRRDDRVR